MNSVLMIPVGVLVFLAFVCWVYALYFMIKSLNHRASGKTCFQVGSVGMFNSANFTNRGKQYRRKMIHAILVFLMLILCLTLYVAVITNL
jgi:hypothetical protein